MTEITAEIEQRIIEKDMVVLKLRSVEDHAAIRGMIDELSARTVEAGRLKAELEQRSKGPLILSADEQDRYEDRLYSLATPSALAPGCAVLADIQKQHLQLADLDLLIRIRGVEWMNTLIECGCLIRELTPFTME